jgi:hypothetical protein
MEELDEFEVLWPEACGELTATSSSPVQPHAEASMPCFDVAVRSRPLDVPRPPALSRRWKDDGDEEGDREGEVGGGKEIVPPHLLLSGRRQSETAWMPGPPCKRPRDLRHLRTPVLRMTGFY